MADNRRDRVRLGQLARTYLASRALAMTGGAIVQVVIPLVVVLTLHGSPAGVAGVLVVTQAVSLGVRLPLSSAIDARGERISWQTLAQLGAAGSSLLVPLLWWAGWLTYASLLACVVVIITFKTFVSTTGYVTVNLVCQPEQRVTFEGRLNSISSTTDIVGAPAGTALLKVLPAPVIMAADTLLSSCAAILLLTMRKGLIVPPNEERPKPSSRARIFGDWPLISRVASQGPVIFLWLIGATGGLAAPVALIYFVRDLQVPAALIGALYAFGAIGGVTGGMVVARLLRRFGMTLLIAGSAAGSGIAIVLVLVVGKASWSVYPAVALFEFLSAFSGVLTVAAVFGQLQERTPRSEIARTMSAASLGLEGLSIPTVAIAGVLGAVYGVRVVLEIAVTCYLLVVIASVVFHGGLTGPDTTVASEAARDETPIDVEAT